MATSKNVAAKSETRGNIDLTNVSKIELGQVQTLFGQFAKAEERRDVARAAFRYGLLMFASTHVDTIIEWDRRFSEWKADGTGAEVRKTRTNARDYFASQAGIEPETAAMEKPVKLARDGKITRFLEDVTVIVAAHRAKAMDAIECDGGVIMVDRSKAYGKALWANIGGETKESLKKLTVKAKPYIVIHAKANQVTTGDADWLQMSNHLQVHAKLRKPTGAGGGRRTTANPAKPLETMATLVNTVTADAESAKVEGKLISTNTEIAKSVHLCEKMLKATCRGPLYSPGWEHVAKGFGMWLKLLGNPTVDVTTPDNVVNLPAKTPADIGKPAADKDTPRNKG